MSTPRDAAWWVVWEREERVSDRFGRVRDCELASFMSWGRVMVGILDE